MANIKTHLSLALMLSVMVGCDDSKKKETTDAIDTKASTNSPAEDQTSQEVTSTEEKKVAAEFKDGKIITAGEVYALLDLLPANLKDKPYSKLYEALLRRSIDSYILKSKAIAAGLDKDSNVLKDMKANRDAVLQKIFLEAEVKKVLTDDELKKNFDELVAKMPKDQKEVQLRHILVQSKSQADKLVKDLKADPSKFDSFVTEFSIDPQTKNSKGSLGYVKQQDLPENFWNLINNAKQNTVLEQPVNMGQNGYSVIFIGEKRPVQPPKFDVVKQKLYDAVTPKYALEVVEKIKKESGVELLGLDGNPLPEKTDGKPTPQKVEDESTLDPTMVVATFKDGSTVTLAEVKESMKLLPPQLLNAPFTDIYEPLLLRLVDQKLVKEKAEASGMLKDKLVQAKLKDAEDATLQKALLDKEAGKMVTDKAMKEKYQELIKLMPKNQMEVRLRHILVKTKQEAEDIISDVKGGKKTFDQLVVDKSLDEQTKGKNGEIGYIRKGDVPEEFAEVVFKAPKATLVNNPISLGDMGWSVVRVEDKRPIEVPKFDQVKPQLKQMLETEKANELLTEWRKAAGVKAFNIEGDPMDILKSPTPTSPMQTVPAQ